MNYRVIFNYLAKIMLLDGICMLPALVIAAVRGEMPSFFGFIIAIAVQVVLGISIHFLIKVLDKRLYAREGIVIVTLSWVIISLFGALPMWLSDSIPSYLNALFETVSGFTTTGATILADVEIMPISILYWRSFTHWLGGMGVLVFLLALLPSRRESGMPLHILRAESPGPTVGKLMPRLFDSARILYVMYFVLTVLELIFLLCGGMPFFDALTTTFGTAGTGGFSIKNDSLASYSIYCQGVTAVFMLLFGVNFSIYFLFLMKDFKDVIKNTELKVYLGIIAVSTLAVSVYLRVGGIMSNFGVSFHHAFFQIVSIITTTGFSTVDFNLWSEFTHTVLMCLMIIGACAGSTGGGIKVSRIVIMFKSLKSELKKLTHPHCVSVVTVDKKPLEAGTSTRCFTFLFIYTVLVAFSVLIISLDGYGFKTNFSAVLACINNIGPGMDLVGPVNNYSFFSPLSKTVLILDMLLGRLELFPLILTLTPSTWKKRNF